MVGAFFAPIAANAADGPIAPGSPAPESKIHDNMLSGVEATPHAYFVQFAGQSVAEGGSLSSIKAERNAFMADASDAGLDVEVRSEFGTLWNGVSVNVDDSGLSALASSSVVEAIFPVGIIDAPDLPQGTIDPALFTAISMTGADIVQSELGFTGAGVKVGIIDTGIDIDHPDLGGNGSPGSTAFPTARVTKGYDFVGDDYNADPSTADYQPQAKPDPNPDDCQGHGTHVAGIVGADGEVTGVAPGVTFGAYRVFGCEGSTEADIMLHAMEKALADKMDVVNLSIGSAFSSWQEYPTSQATDALAREGVIVAASIGNEGEYGPYAAGSPGVGTDTIGVGSVDNLNYMSAVVLDEDGNEIPIAEAAGSTAALPTSGTVELVALGQPGTAEARGCAVTEAPYTDAQKALIDGNWVLVQRGVCSFYEKAYEAQAAGALGVIIYNNAPGVISPTVAGDPPVTIPVGMVSDSDGAALVNDYYTDAPTTITFTDQMASIPNATGGLMSDFSSFGPTADLTIKPDVSAPGGSIYSTYPLEMGGHASLSGTSMASPHVAGAAALMLEADPGLTPHDVRVKLQNSSVQLPLNIAPAAGLEVVHRQGAGLIQIDKSILADVQLEPGLIQLGQQAPGVSTSHTVTLTNLTDTAQTYDVSTEPAVATMGTANDWDYDYADADVTLSAQTVTVPASGSASVDVSITTPNYPTAVYGGYVWFTNETSDYAVGYGGYAGDLQSVEVLADMIDAQGATTLELPVLVKLATCQFFLGVDCTDAAGDWNIVGEGVTYTMEDGDVPSAAIHFEHQARKMVWTAFAANADGSKGQSLGVVKEEDYLARSATRNGIGVYTWDGKVVDANGARVQVPSGDYLIQVEVTKASAWNDTRTAGVESWTSPSFEIAWADTSTTSMVTRYQGQDRYSVATEIALENFPDGSDTVYIASGLVFPDALAGSAKAGSDGHPVLLTRGTALPAATRMALQTLDPSKIIVLGGPATVSPAVMTALGEYGAVTRVGGADRYEVAANVAAFFPTNVDTVFLASGEVFPDALSAAARAGMEDSPVLLTRGTSLPAVTKAQLKRFTPKTIVIVGGPATVSASVKNALGAYADKVVRIGGADRYEVAANLSKMYDTPTAQAWIAKGTDYPDALTAAPVAAMNNSPVLLTRPTSLPASTLAALTRLQPNEIHIAGGLVSVSLPVEDQLASLVYP